MFPCPLLGPIRSMPLVVQLLVKWLFPCWVLVEHLGTFSRCSSKYHGKQEWFSYSESINRQKKTGQVLWEEVMQPAINSVTVTGILAHDLWELSIPWTCKARPLLFSQGPAVPREHSAVLGSRAIAVWCSPGVTATSPSCHSRGQWQSQLLIQDQGRFQSRALWWY